MLRYLGGLETCLGEVPLEKGWESSVRAWSAVWVGGFSNELYVCIDEYGC